MGPGGLSIFIDRVRPIDYVALVEFNSEARTVFPSTPIDSEETRRALESAVRALVSGGGTNINDGLETGYLEVQANYRSDYTNRVLFLTDGMGESERALDLAATFRDLGINVSTIGVGDSFDLELMNAIARTGGGSSRFISDREQMQSIFSDELDRMVVAAARNVDLTVTLPDGVTLVETWGYEHTVSGNTISYAMPTVHNRDYETILIRVEQVPVDLEGAQEARTTELATVAGSFVSLSGERTRIEPISLTAAVSDAIAPLDGVSTYRVIQSAAMLDVALSLREIGTVYFGSGEDQAPSTEAVREAPELTRTARARLLSARRRVDGIGFEEELEILDNYLATLGEQAQLDDEVLQQLSEDESLPVVARERSTIDHLHYLFDEIAQHLDATQSTVAVAPFLIRTNVQYPDAFNDGLRGYIQQVSTTALARGDGLTLVSTEEIENELAISGLGLDDLRDTVRAVEVARSLQTDVFVTGTVLEMSESFVVFARVIEGATERVLAAAQVVIDKETALDDLLGPS